jgi:DnaJ-class molecular chaperone
MADYYAILGISHASETDEIAKAYRRAALTFNPESNQSQTEDKTELARRFRLVSQAYTVLSDAKLRAIYDAYGESGVRHGGTLYDKKGLDVDAIDPDEVFRKFFGVDNPFQAIGDISGLHSTQHRFFSDAAAAKPPPAPEPLAVDVSVTLEEVATGALKTITWVPSTRGGQTQVTDVAIPAGVRDGSSLTLPVAGGPLLVRIHVLTHDTYVREQNDLSFTTSISLSEALTGTTVNIPLLGGRSTELCIDEVVHPTYVLRLPGEGLPDAQGKKGDLIVRFKTNYPAYLTAEQKRELRRVLNQA